MSHLVSSGWILLSSEDQVTGLLVFWPQAGWVPILFAGLLLVYSFDVPFGVTLVGSIS